jgi:hypothetical protein
MFVLDGIIAITAEQTALIRFLIGTAKQWQRNQEAKRDWQFSLDDGRRSSWWK